MTTEESKSKDGFGVLRLGLARNRLNSSRLLELLAGLPTSRIEELNLAHNDLGEATLEDLLRQLPRLKTLSLSSTGLGDVGVQALVAVISSSFERRPTQTGIQSLDLSCCSCETGAAEALGRLLANDCCALTVLDLSFNMLNPEAVRSLGSHLRHNTTLKTLRLDHCRLREEASVLLASLSYDTCRAPLQTISLARNALPESTYRTLSEFMVGTRIGSSLTDLDLSGNSISEEGSSRALAVGLLEGGRCGGTVELRLKLSGTRPFFDPAVGRWNATPHALTALQMPRCQVREVIIDNCTFCEATMPTLARVCLNVSSFSMCDQPLGERFVQCLAELSRGIKQRRSEEDGSIGKNQYPFRLYLVELKLNNAGLQDSGAQNLVDVLHRLCALRRDGRDTQVLELAGNHLTAHGLQLLLLELLENQHLRHLSFSRNKLRQRGAQSVAAWLRQRGHLQQTSVVLPSSPLTLELRHCGLTAEGVLDVWSGVLTGNVASVDLADNFVDLGFLASQMASSLIAAPVPSEPSISSSTPKSPRPGSHSPSSAQCGTPSGRWQRSGSSRLVHQSPAEQCHRAAGSSPPSPARKSVNGRNPGVACGRTCAATLGQVSLLPNAGGSSEAVNFFARTAPWRHIDVGGTSLDGSTLVELLYCLGDPLNADHSCQRENFVLSLAGCSLSSANWQWDLIAETLRYAVAASPTHAVTWAPRGRCAAGPPWRRIGGICGSLLLDLEGCELFRANLAVSQTLTPGHPRIPSCASASLACSARHQVSARAKQESQDFQSQSSQAQQVHELGELQAQGEPVPLAAGLRGLGISPKGAAGGSSSCSNGGCLMSRSTSGSASCLSRRPASTGSTRSRGLSSNGAFAGIASQSGSFSCAAVKRSGYGVPAGASASLPCSPTSVNSSARSSAFESWVLPRPKETEFSQSYERNGLPDVDVSSILRQLRTLEAVRITHCKLTDGQLAQLCHSGSSSKWGGVRLLDLSGNLLSKQCCTALAAVIGKGVESLILDKNRIDAEGLQTLCLAIRPTPNGLLWLSVAENGLGYPAGTVVSELLAREGGCPLRELCLARNPRMSSAEFVEVLRSLSRQATTGGRCLSFLDLSGSSADAAIFPQLQRTLTQCSGLEISLSGTPFAASVALGGAPSSPASAATPSRTGKVVVEVGSAELTQWAVDHPRLRL